MSQTAVLLQLAIIASLFVPAWLLSRWLEPPFEKQARRIKGMPGLLRFVIAFLRRFEWLLFALLLLTAYGVSGAVGWPESNGLIHSAMLLASSWLVISVISHGIRSRAMRKLFAFSAWVYVAALVLGIADELAALLDGAGFTLGGFRLSVLTATQAALLIGIALWASYSVGNFIDRRIQKVDELTPSLRVLLGKISRISLIVLATLIALASLGIDLTALTVLSGAVGVGIGFGLQKVVSNFISGIIILMDQSIKPGDTISLGETFGWIRELRARFVSVVTRDGREFLIPNEDFITREVINWSFSDKFVRLDVEFGVAYDSDPHQVIELAIDAVGKIDRVDSDNSPPVCWMTAFGESSIDFKLRFWINDPQQGLTNIRGKVLLALWDAFKENGVAIPFPHREILLKSPIKLQRSGAPAS
jgi:small-conductance mechanosensitive channel